MIIDADGQVLGRLSTYVAKQALLGNEMVVVNAEKAIISGKREDILKEYLSRLERRSKGSIKKGPYHQKRPDRFVRKVIRGMLPWGKIRGRDAFKRVMVYIGLPKEEIKKKHNIDVDKEKPINLNKKDIDNYLTVGDVCRFIGGSW